MQLPQAAVRIPSGQEEELSARSSVRLTTNTNTMLAAVIVISLLTVLVATEPGSPGKGHSRE